MTRRARPTRLDLVTGVRIVGPERRRILRLTLAELEALTAYLAPLASRGERRQLMRVARRILLDLATGRARLVRDENSC